MPVARGSFVPHSSLQLSASSWRLSHQTMTFTKGSESGVIPRRFPSLSFPNHNRIYAKGTDKWCACRIRLYHSSELGCTVDKVFSCVHLVGVHIPPKKKCIPLAKFVSSPKQYQTKKFRSSLGWINHALVHFVFHLKGRGSTKAVGEAKRVPAKVRAIATMRRAISLREGFSRFTEKVWCLYFYDVHPQVTWTSCFKDWIGKEIGEMPAYLNFI